MMLELQDLQFETSIEQNFCEHRREEKKFIRGSVAYVYAK